jgi:4-amino-4-deoxy-L-arabinose transferase-like glycosyltransferase
VAIWVVSHGDFFARSIGHNFLGKVAQGQEAHGLPPGYHLAAFTLSFWPGSLFAVLAIPFASINRRVPQVRFLLAWIIPTWVAFELVATKLPHYVLPTFPAIACLAAAAAFAPGAWHFGRLWRWVARIYAAVWLMVGLALAAAGPVLLWILERTISPMPVLAGAAVIPLVAAAVWFVWREFPARALACAGMAALLVLVSAYAFVLPNLRTVWLSPRIAAAVAAVRPCPDSIVASGSFAEPSLVFLLGKETRLVNATAAADYLLGHQACGLALIGSKDAPPFLQRMAAGAVTPRALTQISGINYSTGKRLDLTLYAAQ